jgi:NADH-quinone oxidoreductase subunit M
MTLLLLILIPFIFGVLCFAAKPSAKYIALAAAGALTGIGIFTLFASEGGPITLSAPWMPQLGASFILLGDNLSTLLTALTGIVLLVIMIMQQNKEVESPGSFYGLMLLSIAGINGVFLAADGLLFYFFWELALIPVYFLCSQWGGERRIPVTFKFFIYTFLGSLMMLAGLIYLYLQTTNTSLPIGEAITGSPEAYTGGGHSYALPNMMLAAQSLPPATQAWLFLLIFSAFAIKMPIFPFHTWQPDTYESSPTPVTIILSALMVKMGIYGVLRWVIPFFPAAVSEYGNIIITLSVIGIVYASCIAMMQTDLKRLVAYSSIAHMGLMSAAAFSMQSPDTMHAGLNTSGHGLLVQMFNHGINIAGMWLLVQMIENRYGTRDMTKLGGMASGAPWMSIALVIVAFANIALPLTNGFVGEFMLFNGLFQSASEYHIVFMVVAGIGVILGAVYTLTMVQRVAYGNPAEGITTADLSVNEWWALAIVISLILFLGIYPQPFLNLIEPRF